MPSRGRVLLGAGVVAAALTMMLAWEPKDDGQQIFRYDTFGDEKFWTDTARMQEVVQSSVSPTLALKVEPSPFPSPQRKPSVSPSTFLRAVRFRHRKSSTRNPSSQTRQDT